MNRAISLVLCLVLMTSLSNGSECSSRSFGGTYLDVNAILNNLDANNDGKISLAEDRNHIVLGDTSNDGKISRAEFVNRMVNVYCYQKMLASYAFDMIDRNQDGFLTGTDVLVSNFGATGEMDRSVMAMRLQALDARARKVDIKYKTLFALVKQTYGGA
ncbi:hypothetical protein SNE40_017479 [Patella caerulea]|uniref:EF-hand domain-containing protein n=1 Tax=Patella caerulea TaxID=87958 RepID=A0AAN8PFX0_PATCE